MIRTLPRGLLFGLSIVTLTICGWAELTAAAEEAPSSAKEIASFLLDERQSAEARQRKIAENLAKAAEILVHMAPADGASEEEEYRRIPWIWRVSITAGKKNEDDLIRELLNASLPQQGEPLRDWQAVVVGGGLINGISQAGDWPAKRIESLLSEQPAIRKRWTDSLRQASAMADNEAVRSGTRYDALRMIAMEGWEQRGEQLVKYLSQQANQELQMGAVSGLADIDSPKATEALLDHLPKLGAENREIALAALTARADRAESLLSRVEAGVLTPADLGPAAIGRLRDHASATIRDKAARLLPAP